MPHFEHLERFQEIKQLNTGGFSRVKLYKCRDVHEAGVCDKLFVIKKFVKTHYSQTFIDNMMYNEFFHCRILAHKNIIKAFDVDNVNKCVVFEHCNGIDMFDYLEKYSVIDSATIITWFSQLVDAVAYLHDKHVAHMDIKLENIIIDSDNSQLKLIDFGHAVHFERNKKQERIWGTECYMSPEMLSQNGYFPDKVDIWCSGLVLYNMMYNKMPWADSKSESYEFACVYFEHDILHPSIFHDHVLLNRVSSIFAKCFQPLPHRRLDIVELKSLTL
jgi:serine/threonine protein kinase